MTMILKNQEPRNEKTVWEKHGNKTVRVDSWKVVNEKKVQLTVTTRKGLTVVLNNSFRKRTVDQRYFDRLVGKDVTVNVSRDTRTGSWWCYV